MQRIVYGRLARRRATGMDPGVGRDRDAPGASVGPPQPRPRTLPAGGAREPQADMGPMGPIRDPLQPARVWALRR